MNGTNESYVPTCLPTIGSSFTLIIDDDELTGIQPRNSDRRNYRDFIFSIVFAALGIGLYVVVSYCALRRVLKLDWPERTDGEAQDLTDTEDNAEDESEDLAAV